MVAVFGLPGSSHHHWKRVGTRKQGDAWLSEFRDAYEALGETLAAQSQPERVLTEREASQIRYRDGACCYPRDGA